MSKTFSSVALAVVFAVTVGLMAGRVASQTPGEAVAMDSDDLAGRVTGPS